MSDKVHAPFPCRQRQKQEATKGGLIVDPSCPLTALDLSVIKSLRSRMRACGYEPLAVHSPWSLACEQGNAGKAPMGKDWQHGQPDYRLFGNNFNWSRAGSNTGVLLGVGEVPVQALDFDVDDVSTLKSIIAATKGIVPKGSLIRTRANSSRIAMLVRCEDGVLKTKLQGENGAVERLAAGQQVVVDGTHPSGVSLEWRNQRSPWTVDARDLPLLNERAVDAVFAAIAASGALGAKLDRTCARTSRAAGSGPSGDIAREFSEFSKKHGSAVRAVREFLRDTGRRGTHRHDTLEHFAFRSHTLRA